MKNKIFKFVFLVSLFFSMQGFANPINKIDFVGLNVISESSLFALLPIKIGDQYNDQTSNRIIKALFNTDYFSDINVENNNGSIVLVRFGDPNMEIKRDDPKNRANFRARHNCDNPGPKYKARYWSCKFWSAKSVTDLMKG